jgi:hypothetical protein
MVADCLTPWIISNSIILLYSTISVILLIRINSKYESIIREVLQEHEEQKKRDIEYDRQQKDLKDIDQEMIDYYKTH